ncbi:hypothetical protein L1887_47392 [Cichorium endivia]|nr:hypothetical protein L1887_47392 [Cichorium endivia]
MGRQAAVLRKRVAGAEPAGADAELAGVGFIVHVQAVHLGLAAPQARDAGAQVEAFVDVVAQERLGLEQRLLLESLAGGAEVVVLAEEGHVAHQVEAELVAQALDVAGLQRTLPAVLAEVDGAVVVVAAGGQPEEGGDAEVAALFRLVHQPYGGGQDQVAGAAVAAQGRQVVLGAHVAEGQEELRVDDVAAQLHEVHAAQDADIRIQAGIQWQLVAVGVEAVAFGVLVVEQTQVGAGGQGGVIAGVYVERRGTGAKAAQQAEQRSMQPLPGRFGPSRIYAHFHDITFIVFV